MEYPKGRFSRVLVRQLNQWVWDNEGFILQHDPGAAVEKCQTDLGVNIREATLRKYVRNAGLRWKRRPSIHTKPRQPKRETRLERIETILSEILSLLQAR